MKKNINIIDFFNNLKEIEFTLNEPKKTFTFGEILDISENVKKIDNKVNMYFNNYVETIEIEKDREISEIVKNKAIEKEKAIEEVIERQQLKLQKEKETIRETLEKKMIQQLDEYKKQIEENSRLNLENKTKNVHNELNVSKERNNSLNKAIEEKNIQLKRLLDERNRDLKEKQDDKENYRKELNKLLDTIEIIKKQERSMFEEKLMQLEKDKDKEVNELVAQKVKQLSGSKEIGDMAENDIREELRRTYTNDLIAIPDQGKGEADIIHTVKEGESEVGKIYYEVKFRKHWLRANYDNFVKKVQNEKYDMYIYTTPMNSFPKTIDDPAFFVAMENHIIYDSRNNIYIISFESLYSSIFLLRKMLISEGKKKKDEISLTNKKDIIFNFINSQEFKNYLTKLDDHVFKAKKRFSEIKKQSLQGTSNMNDFRDDLFLLVEAINNKLS